MARSPLLPGIVPEGDRRDSLIGRRVRTGGAILGVVQPVERRVMVTRSQPGDVGRGSDVPWIIARERGGTLAAGALVAGHQVVRVAFELGAGRLQRPSRVLP